MRGRLARLMPGDATVVPFILLAVAAGAGAGIAAAHRARLGILVVGVVALALLALYRPIFVGITAVLVVFVPGRLFGSGLTPAAAGGGISYSDVVLTMAAFLAFPAVVGRAELRRLRWAYIGLGLYLICLLPTVFLNSSSHAWLEFAHRLVLVGGGLVVGAWIAREHAVKPTMRALVLVACVVALVACLYELRHGFTPAAPFGMNKNYAGALFGAVVTLVVVAGRQIGLTARGQVLAGVIIALGLLSSQSRGGMLAAAAGLLVAFFLDPRSQTRQARYLSVLLGLGLAAFAYFTIHAQLSQTQAELNNGSLGVRFNVERVTRDVWRNSPTYGVGLKYFVTGDYGRFAVAANNVVDNELAESGVIGLVGFAALQLLAIFAALRRRIDDRLIAAAAGIVVGQLLHGMVDIYWTAGTVTLPFLILGLALARVPEEDEDGERRPARRRSRLLVPR